MESETEKETTKRDEYFEAIENKDVEKVKVILQRSGSDALNKYFDDFGYSGKVFAETIFFFHSFGMK